MPGRVDREFPGWKGERVPADEKKKKKVSDARRLLKRLGFSLGHHKVVSRRKVFPAILECSKKTTAVKMRGAAMSHFKKAGFTGSQANRLTYGDLGVVFHKAKKNKAGKYTIAVSIYKRGKQP